MCILDVLPHGESNAISSQELMNICGYSNTRALQQGIETLRRAGHVIASSSKPPGGYFYPVNELELRVFIRTIESRAKSSFRSLKSARQALKKLETANSGQQVLNEQGNA